jgi:hypothetical protein
MSSGTGVVLVQPLIATHAALGAAQSAAVAAAGTIAAAAAGIAVTAAVGAGTAWAVSQALQAGSAWAGRAADACDRALIDVRRWEGMVRQVAQHNARLGAVLGAAAAAGVPRAAAAPDLMVLTNQTPQEVGAWCRQAEAAVRDLERDLAGDRARTLDARWKAAVAAQVVAAATAEAGIRPRSSTPVEEALRDRVQQVLAAIPVQASAAEQEELLAAGEAALAVPPWETEVRLEDLEVRLRSVRAAVRRRSEMADRAAVLVQPLLPEGPTTSPAAAAAAGIARDDLLDVIAGRRDLDDDLRARAIVALNDRVTAAQQVYAEAMVLTEANALNQAEGLEVVQGVDGRIGVRLPGHGDRELRMRMSSGPDSNGVIGWSAVRVGDDPHADADPVEENAACEEAVAVMGRLTDRLRARGVDQRGERRTGPTGALPVAVPLPVADAVDEDDDEELRLRDEERRRRDRIRATARVRQQP